MSTLDWIILIFILVGIIIYGVFKTSATRNIEGYFLNNRSMPWYLLLLGIMGTQASAITFLTGPGQAYSDGMRFVQYYFGLPLAMLLIAFVFVPVFSRFKVITAYEFLENRFDIKTRTLTSVLFLISRGLSTGISIYAPSIVLSTLLGWNIYITNIIMGGFLIIYTMSGGARAVAHTQKIQMILVFVTLALTGWYVVKLLPGGSIVEAINEAGTYGKMNTLTSGFTENGFDWKDRYNLFSGVIGGFFLALSYFGTDHSQVGRYITGKDDKQIKKGLLLNGLIKVPMQLFILFLGVLVFVFYLNNKAPVYFNPAKTEAALKTPYGGELLQLQKSYEAAQLSGNRQAAMDIREKYKSVIKKALPAEDTNDVNFIFLRFVLDYLPKGLIGLIIAILFLSAWGSIAAALNALAACSMVDIHKRFFAPQDSERTYFKVSQYYTLFWGLFCIAVSMFAHNIGNSLIETVNIIGSLFYGVILGIFLVAMFIKHVKAQAVFWASLISEALVLLVYKLDVVSFLWLNVIGAIAVIVLGLILQAVLQKPDK